MATERAEELKTKAQEASRLLSEKQLEQVLGGVGTNT